MKKTVHFGAQKIYPIQQFESIRIWRKIQIAVLAVGILIFLSLVFFPNLGLNLFWNFLIPIAPALFVLAVGVWRNICPLGTFSLLPHHFNFSKKKRLTVRQQGKLSLAGVALLFVIVPFRHLIFDTNGWATALLLAVAAVVAFGMGVMFEWKSGWCSGICPVHPVEKLYGEKVTFTPPNAHCTSCANCVIPCPDSTKAHQPTHVAKSKRSLHRLSACLLTGGLPGFIWGWFHVPNHFGGFGWTELLIAFAWPWGGALGSLALFHTGRYFLEKEYHRQWSSLFAAAAVGCYYWYRLPALVGHGIFPGDGVLVDLSGWLPLWSISVSQFLVLVFFAWWLFLRENKQLKEWAVRPPFLVKRKVRQQTQEA
jgi:hypothetical protein